MGVVLSALFLGSSLLSSCVRLSCLSASVVFVYLSSVLLSALCGCSLCFFCRALASCWCACRGGVSLARVVMYVAVSVSSLLLSPALKKAREVLPCAQCLLLLLFVPSSCFLSICSFYVVLVFVCVHARAWRWRALGVRLMSSCDAALLTQAPLPAHCLLTVLFPCFIIIAEAAPAVPRQQRRKEARAQADEDVRRVRQRMDEADVRLDTLEGRLRGHDLRLQYLEAPLKLVLKKFKAPVEFWAAKDTGFQAAKSAFSAAFLRELRDAGSATVQHLLEEAEPIMAELDSHVIIGVFRAGGSTQDRDGTIVPDAVLRLRPGDQGFRLGYLLAEQHRPALG